MSIEPNQTNNQDTEDIEEFEEEFEEEEEEILEDPRLRKSVDRMIKQAKRYGLDPKKLEGKSLEQQYDLLDFYLDNKPKRRKKKNEPVLPGQTQIHNEPKLINNVRQTENGIHWQIPVKNYLKRTK